MSYHEVDPAAVGDRVSLPAKYFSKKNARGPLSSVRAHMHRDEYSDRMEWMRSALAEHEGPLLRYAVRLTGNLERARDVVQDTFLRLCREHPERLNSHLPAWLFTVCRNRALDLLRKEGRTTALTDADLAAPILRCDADGPVPWLRDPYPRPAGLAVESGCALRNRYCYKGIAHWRSLR